MIAWLLACGGAEDPISATAVLPEDRYALVGESVLVEAVGSEGVEFVFDAGNGSSVSGESPAATLSWDAPGHYTVFLTATGSDGQTARDQMRVTVTWPLQQPAPAHASPLATWEDHLVAALPDEDRIAVVDRATGLVEHVPVCDEPRTVSVLGSDAFVACAADDSVVRVALGGGGIDAVAELGYGARPYGVVATDAGVQVTLQGTGELVHLDRDLSERERTAVDADLRGLAVTADAVWVSRWRSAEDAGRVHRVADGVSAHDLAPAPGPDSDTDSRGLPNLLQQIVASPDGRTAIVPALKSNVFRGLWVDGRQPDAETTVRSAVRRISLHPDEGPVGAELLAPLFDNRDHAIAAAFAPRGEWLYVAHHGAQVVDVLDPWTLERVGGIRDIGEGPDALVLLDGGDTLAVLASLSQELVLYDVRNPALELELDRIDLSVVDPALSPAERLGKQLFYAAVDPRMTSEQYVSCGSCHPEGSNDARTWDFTDRGEGLRNTHSLQGTSGAAPLHWSANFDEVQDFEHDIRGPQQGRGLMSDADFAATSPSLGPPKAGFSADLDALAVFVESLDWVPRSPHRQPDGSLTDQAAAGEALFLSDTTGCATCHVPPTYTDSQWLEPGVPLLHDVGTLTEASGQRLGSGPLPGVDTPTLRGLFDTAPYLHDGSAATVMDVLTTANPTDAHGTTSTLSPEELAQLEAFLLSLD